MMVVIGDSVGTSRVAVSSGTIVLASVFRQYLVWICAAYRRIMRATFVILSTLTSAVLMLGFAGRWMIGVWAGKTAVPSWTFLCGMCFWTVLLVLLDTVFSYLLFVILPQTFEVRRILRGRYLPKRNLDAEALPEIQTYGV